MNLFIDDVRSPEDVGFKNVDFYVVRTGLDAVNYIEYNKPQYIAFDHDLGFDEYGDLLKTGMWVATWLVNQDCRDPKKGYITKSFRFSVHSANPIGKKNIESLLNNYMKHKFGE